MLKFLLMNTMGHIDSLLIVKFYDIIVLLLVLHFDLVAIAIEPMQFIQPLNQWKIEINKNGRANIHGVSAVKLMFYIFVCELDDKIDTPGSKLPGHTYYISNFKPTSYPPIDSEWTTHSPFVKLA